jgi:AcrR family transcriptional regulator
VTHSDEASASTRGVDVEPSLRERRRLEQRRAMVAAALDLAATRPWAEVSVDEIAARAGVSRRTFFRTFETKDAVLMDRRKEQLRLFREELARAPEGRPLAALEQALARLATTYERDKRRILAERALFASSRDLQAADGEIDRLFEEAIVDALATRRGGDDETARSARYFAAAAMGILRVAIDEWAASRGRVDLRETSRPAMKLLRKLLDV